jgi:predicted transcriptional regulator
MPLIPPRPVESRDTLALRLDHALHERLGQYAEFIQSPKHYVVAHALQRLFRSDREFIRWLAIRGQSMAGVEADSTVDNGGSSAGEIPTGEPTGGPSRTRRVRGE